MQRSMLSKVVAFGLALVAFVICLWQLEAERATVQTESFATNSGPVTLYRARGETNDWLVMFAHGFAGSRQMMQYLSRDLARAGFTVAAFDFDGHGRNITPMSPDVTRIEGTTRQLVAQTIAVTKAVQDATGLSGPLAVVGHSMATDIVIRAARQISDVEAVVAISMYSDAITPDFPQRLLAIAGAWEGRLRAAGLRAVAQIDPDAGEGTTVRQGDVLRRTVSIAGTEHVSVLFSAETARETRKWILAAMRPGHSAGTLSMPRGPQIIILLASFVIIFCLATGRLSQTAPAPLGLTARQFFSVSLLPAAPAVLCAAIMSGPLFGLAGFRGLLVFLVVWGATALILLWRAGYRPRPFAPSASGLLVLCSLGGFALLLDRYGAAFLPVGPRLALMAALLPATLPFVLADSLLVAKAVLWQRCIARSVPLLALLAAMLLSPRDMGLLFTVLPVLLLFYIVYGTMGRAVAKKAGPEAAAAGQAVVLAWAIAASTPLFLAAPS